MRNAADKALARSRSSNPNDLYAPLGAYSTSDGYKIDGSLVRFWATKKAARDAARSIGWPAKSVTKVHTRFQVGWAIVDTRFGALSRDGFGTLVRRKEKEGNPVGLILTAVSAAAAASAITYATIGGPRGTVLIFEEIAGYEGSVLLMRKSGAVGHIVDDSTGRGGFSHAAIDLGWVDDEGKAVCVESLALHGVRVTSIEDRSIERIQLTAAETTYARGAAQALLTQKTPYRGRRGGLNCAEFVVACLPRSWRADLPKNPSPNDLAKAWL